MLLTLSAICQSLAEMWSTGVASWGLKVTDLIFIFIYI